MSVPTPRCPLCGDPESLCTCDETPARQLALSLIKVKPLPGTVSISSDDLLALAERAYAWGQHQSASASETREPIGLFWQTSDGKWHFSPGSTKRGDIHDNGRSIRVAYIGEEAT